MSFSCVMYERLSGRVPWSEESVTSSPFSPGTPGQPRSPLLPQKDNSFSQYAQSFCHLWKNENIPLRTLGACHLDRTGKHINDLCKWLFQDIFRKGTVFSNGFFFFYPKLKVAQKRDFPTFGPSLPGIPGGPRGPRSPWKTEQLQIREGTVWNFQGPLVHTQPSSSYLPGCRIKLSGLTSA